MREKTDEELAVVTSSMAQQLINECLRLPDGFSAPLDETFWEVLGYTSTYTDNVLHR